MTQPSGIPTDAGPTLSCVAVPAGCEVHDCTGSACPVCVAELCAYYPDLAALVSLMGRALGCPAA